jgi:hypothetical protein
VGDLNGDETPDLVIANALSGDVSVFRGRGDGSFTGEERLPCGGNPEAVLIGDLTGDGIVDLATANGIAGNISILVGQR